MCFPICYTIVTPKEKSLNITAAVVTARTGKNANGLEYSLMNSILNRYDANFFADMLEKSTADRKKRGKPARKNRYYHYCSWAHALMVSKSN